MASAENKILEELSTRWSASVDVELCSRLVRFILRAKSDQTERMTFLDFSRASGVKADDDRLLKAVSLLASHFQILEMHLVYFDDFGMSHDMDDEEMRYFFATRQVVDRERGKLIDNAARVVFPYFKATPFQKGGNS